MSTNNSTPENSIASEQNTDHRITGPHHEPPTVANATTYWRCEACERESIREQDLHREAFHAEDCGVADRC
ncbi:hypothetical protein [Halalkalicoccus sp. NIPERK01]|uniref:hypothetical protein n=1 Tax=Halalkalicoccus sp. NIPERK01 TaxID=3053469 RepID=UPI00256F4E47|nr:hypothetical protein [Halalkalicoccus sp. NIPERK01]MDL5363798.1 hypothetical protein [Halalkalicoccus sp. NIPERK01]